MSPELIADYACKVGEGPLWHPMEKRLYWTDIETGRMFRYEPAGGKHEQCYQGPRVGGYTVQADGSLLLFRDKGNIVVWRDGQVVRTVTESIPTEADGRFNDVIADPEGRVYCGTLMDNGKPGRLFRLDRDGRLTQVLDGIGCSNGMGFTGDLKTLYFTDSVARLIYQFDYNRKTGGLSRQREWVKVPNTPGEGIPDGMTVDDADTVWSARWDGSCVVRYDPFGREIARIMLPTLKCSSVVFAGEDYTDMYLTTAGGDDKAKNGPSAGALYRVRAGVRGRPEFFSRIGI